MAGRTRRTITLLTFAVVAMLITAIVAQVAKDNITITGVVSCSFCAGNHSIRVRKGPNQDQTCTRICISQGAQYMLSRDREVYRLSGNLRGIDRLVGQRVTVTGATSVRGGHSELSVVSVH
jgi:hypothetical protein